MRMSLIRVCIATEHQFTTSTGGIAINRKTTIAKLCVLLHCVCEHKSRVNEKPDDKTMLKRERNIFSIELSERLNFPLDYYIPMVFFLFFFFFLFLLCLRSN